MMRGGVHCENNLRYFLNNSDRPKKLTYFEIFFC